MTQMVEDTQDFAFLFCIIPYLCASGPICGSQMPDLGLPDMLEE
jgi:hypothetical protein